MRTRTGYSFKTAYGPLDSVVDRLKAIGSTVAPITDRTSTYGFTKFAKLAKAANMRTVYGVELAVTPRLGERKPALDMWTFFARDHLRPLHELIKTATSNPGKVPSLTYNQALNAPGVFVLAGERLLIDELPKELPPHFFFALAPSVPRGLLKRVRARGIPLVASSDNYFPCAEDEEVYRITIGGRSGTQTYPRWILSDDEWLGWVKRNFPLEEEEIAKAILLRDKLLGDCTAQQKTGELLRFRNEKSLLELCEDGARKKGVDVWDNPVYRERLHRELNLIKEKDFEDYFFILADVVDWARSRMLVGPARGSSCGSLACFLLNITTIDPIPYGLIFERFVDSNRSDLPDVDVDLSDKRRHLVFEYTEQKFGRAHVARLGTVGLFAPRSAIKASAAALRVPEWRANKVMDVMVERSSGDSRAMLRLQDTLEGTEAGKSLLQEFPEMAVASRLEGHPNNASQHAAGIILTAEPVIEYVAVDARTNATMCDKKDAEVLNLLKVDALGLTQLSIFERTLELIGVPPPEWENFLLKIPLDDDEAFKVLRDGKFSGVFQFAGVAVRSLTGQCKVDKFDDLVALGALARPGPLATGGATLWLNRRMGREAPETLHPLLFELTKDTYGVVVFQETVMRVVREVGGLSWEDTSIIRKAMSGRQGDEVFAKHRANFVAGAKRLHNIDSILAEQIWKQVSTFGCLSGDTIIHNPFKNAAQGDFKLKDLAAKGGLVNGRKVKPMGGNGKSGKKWRDQKHKILSLIGPTIKPQPLVDAYYSGRKQTYELKVDSGETIRATKNHYFLTKKWGWVSLGKLKIGDLILLAGTTESTPRKTKKGTGSGGHNWVFLDSPRYSSQTKKLRCKFKRCQDCKLAPYEETHHINGNHEDHSWSNLLPVCRKCHKRLHKLMSGRTPAPYDKGKTPRSAAVVSISKPEFEETFDIAMPAPHHNFVANNFIVHNSWSFNKSHAVAYAFISYWCCWLKAHHAVEFAAATLDMEADQTKQISLLKELQAEGVGYVPFDKDHSTAQWGVKTNADGTRQLIGPLTIIKGIGPAMVREILDSRMSGKPLRAALAKRLEGATTPIDTLTPIADRVKALHPDLTALGILSPITQAQKLKQGTGHRDVVIVGVVKTINPRWENEPVRVQQRGYAIRDGKEQSVNIFVVDDSDEIFIKIDRHLYPKRKPLDFFELQKGQEVNGDTEEFGKLFLSKARAGKSIFAVKGEVPEDFRMIRVRQMKYLGELT